MEPKVSINQKFFFYLLQNIINQFSFFLHLRQLTDYGTRLQLQVQQLRIGTGF